MNKDFDIDIVVLWVDGNDEEWLKEKNQYSMASDELNKDNRFRDWDLMKYWFRGIETFAPWHRKIHFVTWGHLPSFLNANNERLHIVRHKDFMSEECLPTFNSKALEMNLHRIKGLSERFIYFNDDMFLTAPLPKANVFDEKMGFPKMEFMEIPLRMKGAGLDWEISLANDIGLVNKHFNKRDVTLGHYFGKYLSTKYPLKNNIRNFFAKILYPEFYTGIKIYHTYSPLLKSAFEGLWEKEPEYLMKVSRQKFRELEAVNQWAILAWQFANGTFSPAKDNSKLWAIDEKDIKKIASDITSKQYVSVCLNDPEHEVDYEYCKYELIQAFEELLPNKCSYEL